MINTVAQSALSVGGGGGGGGGGSKVKEPSQFFLFAPLDYPVAMPLDQHQI